MSSYISRSMKIDAYPMLTWMNMSVGTCHTSKGFVLYTHGC